MFELKVAGAFLVSFSTGLLGFLMARDLGRRIWLLTELGKGLRLLSQEIEYRRSPLAEAAYRVGRTLKDPWLSFFCEVGKELEELPGTTLYQVWDEKSRRYLSEESLKREDLEIIDQIGRELGGPEMAGHSQMLALYEKRLEELIGEAKEEYRSKARLYGRLGIAGGIFMVILLI